MARGKHEMKNSTEILNEFYEKLSANNSYSKIFDESLKLQMEKIIGYADWLFLLK
jgi:hypothetical protein